MASKVSRGMREGGLPSRSPDAEQVVVGVVGGPAQVEGGRPPGRDHCQAAVGGVHCHPNNRFLGQTGTALRTTPGMYGSQAGLGRLYASRMVAAVGGELARGRGCDPDR